MGATGKPSPAAAPTAKTATATSGKELLNLAQLRAFRLVAEMGSATRAAAALFRAQSAVTRSVQELEAALGEPLFDRGPSGMLPTPVCRAVLHRCERIFAELEELAQWCTAREARRRPVAEGALPEHEPHPRIFAGLLQLIPHIPLGEPTLARLIEWETVVLSDLGYGLDLSACAATGAFLIRKGPFKYVHYVGMPPQLFDLDSDPQETRDLAREPGYAGLVSDCEAVLRRVVDPDAADALAKSDQRGRIEAFGGREAILKLGSFGYSPAPGTKPVYN